MPRPRGRTFRAVIAAVAEVDPLVYLVGADDSGYAVLVEGEDATVLRLPGLTMSEVRRAAGSIGDRPTPRRLLDVTRWLWDAGFDALAGRLAGRDAVNIVATGALGLLPLHAAWRTIRQAPMVAAA